MFGVLKDVTNKKIVIGTINKINKTRNYETTK